MSSTLPRCVAKAASRAPGLGSLSRVRERAGVRGPAVDAAPEPPPHPHPLPQGGEGVKTPASAQGSFTVPADAPPCFLPQGGRSQRTMLNILIAVTACQATVSATFDP
ncbi:hypothetical protein GCM10027019_14720 [Melaminivora jejuensis]